MSSVSRDCERIISKYRAQGMSRDQAIAAAIDRVSHEIVFFMRNHNARLEDISRRRLAYMNKIR